jgi:hypothetical protein
MIGMIQGRAEELDMAGQMWDVGGATEVRRKKRSHDGHLFPPVSGESLQALKGGAAGAAGVTSAKPFGDNARDGEHGPTELL